jgi:hypothetical protein
MRLKKLYSKIIRMNKYKIIKITSRLKNILNVMIYDETTRRLYQGIITLKK